MRSKRVILMGGLGNQLFQYAFSLRLATESGGSVVLDPNLGTIRLNGEGHPELSSFQTNFDFSPVDKKSTSNFAKRLVGLLVRSHLTAPSFQVRLFNFLLTIFAKVMLSIHYREIIRLHVSSDAGHNSVDFRKNLFIGYFQTYSYSNPEIEGEILQKITPRNLGKGYLELARKASSEHPLIVHIRLTDYLTEEKFGIPSYEYYQRAIETQWISGKYNKIWLFSDDLSAARDFIPKIFREHISEINLDEFDSAQTLNVMRLGFGYVLANSTFSWWAARLSNTRDALVIYPDPWFESMPSPKAMCPPNWVSIPR